MPAKKTTQRRYKGTKRPSPDSDQAAPRAMVDSYIETALWSSEVTDEDGNDKGSFEYLNFDKGDLTPAALKTMEADCAAFFEEAEAAIEARDHDRSDKRDLPHEREAQLGHDFWLTRNRHGAGFWDGDWPKALGKKLTDLAHSYGGQNLYLDAEEDEDGEIIGGKVGVE